MHPASVNASSAAANNLFFISSFPVEVGRRSAATLQPGLAWVSLATLRSIEAAFLVRL